MWYPYFCRSVIYPVIFPCFRAPVPFTYVELVPGYLYVYVSILKVYLTGIRNILIAIKNMHSIGEFCDEDAHPA